MHPNYVWPDPEDRANKLAGVAAEFVDRIRTEEPTQLCRELLGPLDGWDMWGLICLLAAAVDPSVHPDIWWGWVRYGVTPRSADPVRWDDTSGAPEADDPEVTVLDRIRHLAVVARLTDQEIADRVGMSHAAVTRRRLRAGIPPAHPQPPRRKKAATEEQVAA